MGSSHSTSETTPTKTFFPENDQQNGIPSPNYSDDPDKERNFNIMKQLCLNPVSWTRYGNNLIGYIFGKNSVILSWYQVEKEDVKYFGTYQISYTSDLFSAFDSVDDIKKIILECMANRGQCEIRLHNFYNREYNYWEQSYLNQNLYMELCLFCDSPVVKSGLFSSEFSPLWGFYADKVKNEVHKIVAGEKIRKQRRLIREHLHGIPAAVPIYKNISSPTTESDIAKSDGPPSESTKENEVVPVAVVLSGELISNMSEV